MTDGDPPALPLRWDGVAGWVGLAGDRAGVTEHACSGGVPRWAGLRTIFRLASITKLLTSVLVLRQVECSRVDLDEPVRTYLPDFARLPVLAGFDPAGAPVLRPPRTAATVRQLLAHTSGAAYEIWNPDAFRYHTSTGTPSAATGDRRSLGCPLVADPGAAIHYGTGADWAGLLVEAVTGSTFDDLLQTQICEPLGTVDMTTVLDTEQAGRCPSVRHRSADGRWSETAVDYPVDPDFRPGGGCVYATAADVLLVLRALLCGGALGGRRLLRPESVRELTAPQTGPLRIPVMRSSIPFLSCDVPFGPEWSWGLGGCVNHRALPGRRSAGSFGWAGLYNGFFWIDPTADVAAVLFLNHLPFVDEVALSALDSFERAVYRGRRPERATGAVAARAPASPAHPSPMAPQGRR
ncbi:serine hydrolase domain-containing protein [Nakamurella endophytica]|uniref:Beta-lactamase-related domain-containing protein n=1 Tax=Nakamurella endophytica TaxID=1748367 RepID=A0A917STX1_9ACTN|nr:serine hydrolase domain-containing protein [Nakamurella endophytica]GGL94713.1 hypothetical protein GCM10011594_13170 [Nakamurella endophytica]